MDIVAGIVAGLLIWSVVGLAFWLCQDVGLFGYKTNIVVNILGGPLVWYILGSDIFEKGE